MPKLPNWKSHTKSQQKMMTEWVLEQLFLIAEKDYLRDRDDPVPVALLEEKILFTSAKVAFDSALARRDLDEMVANTSDIRARRYALAKLVPKRGRRPGTKKTDMQANAAAARRLVKKIKRIWKQHYGIQKRPCSPHASEIVEGFFDQFGAKLPANWQDQH